MKEKSKNLDSVLREKDNANDQVLELKSQLLDEKNKKRKILREKWIESEKKKWRNKTWREFAIFVFLFVCGITFILFRSNWNLDDVAKYLSEARSDLVIGSLISLYPLIYRGV